MRSACPLPSKLYRMRTISAPAIVLEPLTEGHAPEMFAVLSDPAIYEFENRPPASLEALASRFWRRGIGSSAVAAMLDELRSTYAVNLYVTVLKARNFRSAGLLRKLGFEIATDAQFSEFGSEADELVMVKPASGTEDAAGAEGEVG